MMLSSMARQGSARILVTAAGCQRVAMMTIRAMPPCQGPSSSIPTIISCCRTISSSPILSFTKSPGLDVDPDRKHFETQSRLWHTYVETGQGANDLFDTFLDNPNDQTISAERFRNFLNQVGHEGMGDDEFEELQGMKDLNVQDFRSWIRHATHDWSVHV